MLTLTQNKTKMLAYFFAERTNNEQEESRSQYQFEEFAGQHLLGRGHQYPRHSSDQARPSH